MGQILTTFNCRENYLSDDKFATLTVKLLTVNVQPVTNKW